MSDDFNLDWDKALAADEAMGEGGFEPIPSGTYTVKVTEAEAKTFSTGNPGIKLKLAVVGGPYADRLLWSNLVWNAANPQSMGMFSKKVVSFGVAREWLAATNPSLKAICAELLGRMASATVEVKEFNGRKTNDVKRISSLGEGAASVPLPPTPGVPSAPLPPVVPPIVPSAPIVASPAAPAPLVVDAPTAPAPAPATGTGTAYEATDEEPF